MMQAKPSGYVGLIVLLITLAIMIYLMTINNSPLMLWYGGGKQQSAPLKQQVNQLQLDENQRVKDQQKAIDALTK